MLSVSKFDVALYMSPIVILALFPNVVSKYEIYFLDTSLKFFIFEFTFSGVKVLTAPISLLLLVFKTIIFGEKKFWRFTDQIVADEALNAYKTKANIIMDSQITEMKINDNNTVTIYYFDESKRECIQNVDYVNAATGRIPNLKKLKLEDIGTGVYDYVYNTCISNLEGETSLFDNWKDSVKEELNKEGNWYFTDNGIRIIFQKYSISDGSFGIKTIDIKKDEINKYLLNKYKIK